MKDFSLAKARACREFPSPFTAQVAEIVADYLAGEESTVRLAKSMPQWKAVLRREAYAEVKRELCGSGIIAAVVFFFRYRKLILGVIDLLIDFV